MATETTTSQRVYQIAGAITAWFAIALQLYLIIVNRKMAFFPTIIAFFSYFTILTNILAAFCYTFQLIKPAPGLQRFFSESKTITAIAVYITVVGIVYNVILRYLWAPQGQQLLADELLHSFNPAFFVLYWLLFVPKRSLKWADAFPWLLYPFIYLLYIMLRGALSGLYPYPFIEVSKLGYPKVLMNSGILFIAFLLLSLLFIASGKLISRSKASH
jgi:hypothetical protein